MSTPQVEDKAAAEVQKEVQCQQFRELLKEKERELEELAEGSGRGGWSDNEAPLVDVDRHTSISASQSLILTHVPLGIQ